MKRALDFFVVEGIKTSIPLHREILRGRGVPRRPVLDPLHGAVRRAAPELKAAAFHDAGAQRLRPGRIYAIADAEALGAARPGRERRRRMAQAGIATIQLRAKRLADERPVRRGRALPAARSRAGRGRSGSTIASTSRCCCRFAGVHLGQRRPAGRGGAPAAGAERCAHRRLDPRRGAARRRRSRAGRGLGRARADLRDARASASPIRSSASSACASSAARRAKPLIAIGGIERARTSRRCSRPARIPWR